jgi:hypothetical protein
MYKCEATERGVYHYPLINQKTNNDVNETIEFSSASFFQLFIEDLFQYVLF